MLTAAAEEVCRDHRLKICKKKSI